MRFKCLLLLVLFFIFSNARGQANFEHIINYSVYYGWAHNAPQDWVVLRKFENRGKPYFLMVNPQTLQTKVDEPAAYQFKPMTLPQLRGMFKNSAYARALGEAEKKSVMIQNAGIERGIPTEMGISLTADLCPSHRPLDKRIFTDMISGFQKVERPVPIALSISGVWMQRHQADLQWLKQLQQKQEIYITWVNHSFTHRVSASRPLKENFLLEPGTNISYEVLETEKLMLKEGLLPSVFFRFPGLVSDQQLVYAITNFGLIPIGTDAWLAKGQHPQAGSIVLIHGNGNEPVGVAEFIKLLQQKAPSIAKKQWLLYDLRETVDEEFEGSH
ncbi:polysaccharide deacetylase family protein [Mucilaginibacter ginkgonis]|uniref:Polysaccharide deacetylase n=1 Tax=Mucilaginibacter ginkgonis TaxID=2682091 RepID=A0A6I4HXA1_9SPHI|nr:polysaccharide deacetylase [Mucilaginibacter ginkgonis]QQL49309.1 polysaccharide deacetylase [Mucilaginibacter ginkgonis]